MAKSHICYDNRCKCGPEIEHQTEEYVPLGPVTIQKKLKKKVENPKPIEVTKSERKPKPIEVTKSERKPGWLYDFHSGVCLGPASDELKAVHRSGEVWERVIAGLKQKVVIG